MNVLKSDIVPPANPDAVNRAGYGYNPNQGMGNGMQPKQFRRQVTIKFSEEKTAEYRFYERLNLLKEEVTGGE